MAKKTGEKYEAIIDAAVRVIAKHGYHSAQVSRIAKEAKVADGTIYLYFENKDDILISLFREKMLQLIETGDSMKEFDSVEQKLYYLIQGHLTYLMQNPEFAIVTQIEMRQSNPEVNRGIGEVLKKYFDVIDDIVREGMEAGVFHPDIDVRLARTMIFGTLDQAVTSWVMKQCKYDLTTLVEPIHRFFLHGLKEKS